MSLTSWSRSLEVTSRGEGQAVALFPEVGEVLVLLMVAGPLVTELPAEIEAVSVLIAEGPSLTEVPAGSEAVDNEAFVDKVEGGSPAAPTSSCLL